MALINCPDCSKPVSDQALSCVTCGFPIRAHLAQLKREEEARQAQVEEEARQQYLERQRTITIGFLVVIAFTLFIGVGSCINYNNQHPELQSLSGHANLQDPGDYAFPAQGKLQLQYACQSSTEKATTVQFSLVNMHATGAVATVWKKVITCTTPSQDTITNTATVPVVSSTYDIGAIASAGDTTWNIEIRQA